MCGVVGVGKWVCFGDHNGINIAVVVVVVVVVAERTVVVCAWLRGEGRGGEGRGRRASEGPATQGCI